MAAAQQIVEVHDIAELATVRHDLGLYLQSCSLPAQASYELLTCLQEASMNALRFGASPRGVQISVKVGPREILITVRDHGDGLELRRVSDPPPDSLSESGRGLFLLCALMDRVEFRVKNGTEVRLYKWLAPPSTPHVHLA